MKIIQRLNHPLLPLVITAAAYFIFLMIRLNTLNAAFFVQAGEQLVDTTQSPPNLFTVTPHTGYDGTFHYRLALTPFTRERTAFGITLDTPRYRQQRILYPLLSWFFSFASPPLAIYALIAVNFLALCALGWLGGLYAQAAGRHALWGAVFALYPGFIFTLSRDLTEIIEALAVLAALVALQRSRSILATGLLVAGCLAKETAILMAAVVCLLWIVKRLRTRLTSGWYIGAIPLAVFAGWQLVLHAWWHVPLLSDVTANLAPPLMGLIAGFQSASTVVGGSQLRWALEVSALALFAIGVAVSLRRSTASAVEKVGWLAYGALMLILTTPVWIEDWGFLRATSLFSLLGLAIMQNTRGRLSQWIFIAGLSSWIMLAGNILYVRP